MDYAYTKDVAVERAVSGGDGAQGNGPASLDGSPSAPSTAALEAPPGDASTPLAVTAKPPPSNPTETLNSKTDREFERLEAEIGRAYLVVEEQTSKWGASLGGFWGKVQLPVAVTQASAQLNERLTHLKALVDVELLSTKVQQNLEQAKTTLVKFKEGERQTKMMELLSANTNQYLDSLDKELEVVETAAGNLVSSVTSFFSGALTLEAPEDSLPQSQEKTVIAHSRTEAQMYTLHSSPELYLTAADTEDESFKSFIATFDLSSQTAEISHRLESIPALRSLTDTLVPTRVSYADFWARYFYMLAKIQHAEQKRAALVGGSAEDPEDFAWDDEDDDEQRVTALASKPGLSNPTQSPAGSSRASSDVTYALESVNGSTLDVVAAKRDSQPVAGDTMESVDEDTDDQDDDWE